MPAMRCQVLQNPSHETIFRLVARAGITPNARLWSAAIIGEQRSSKALLEIEPVQEAAFFMSRLPARAAGG